MRKIAILLFTIMVIVVGFFSGCNEKKETGESTSELKVDIDMSVDKTIFNSDESVNITVTVRNNMDTSFPFGNYSLELGYVNKSDYDSGGVWSAIHISDVFVDSINVAAGDTYTGSILWNTTVRNIDPGDYYIRFEIHKNIGYTYSIQDDVSIKITFI